MVFYSGGSRPSDRGGGLRNKAKGDGRGGRGGLAPPLDPPLFNVFINCLRLSCCASFS